MYLHTCILPMLIIPLQVCSPKTHIYIYIYIYIYYVNTHTYRHTHTCIHMCYCTYVHSGGEELLTLHTSTNYFCSLWKSGLSDRIKRNFFQAVTVSILLYGCTAWTLTKCIENKKDRWELLHKNVFIGNPFEMRLLNLRINFLLRTFVLILVVFCCFSHCISAKFHL